MDVLIAPVNKIEFKIDKDLTEQCGAMPLPFFGMDKSMAAVCLSVSSQMGLECDRGAVCPFRHIRGDRTIVCKHWLRGLCKKGDQCEFLHEYDMKKMPECYFYSRFNACHNKECPFLHIDPESKVKDCPWYDRGFCRHGPHCRHRHVRRVLCTNYLAGFCPDGWECKHVHPRFELPSIADLTKDQAVKKIPTCHFCGELGHKASTCKKLPEISGEKSRFFRNDAFKHHGENRSNVAYANGAAPPEVSEMKENLEDSGSSSAATMQSNNQPFAPLKISKPIEEITCYKCGNKGHYANKCPKGHLAFLSNQRSHK